MQCVECLESVSIRDLDRHAYEHMAGTAHLFRVNVPEGVCGMVYVHASGFATYCTRLVREHVGNGHGEYRELQSVALPAKLSRQR